MFVIRLHIMGKHFNIVRFQNEKQKVPHRQNSSKIHHRLVEFLQLCLTETSVRR